MEETKECEELKEFRKRSPDFYICVCDKVLVYKTPLEKAIAQCELDYGW